MLQKEMDRTAITFPLDEETAYRLAGFTVWHGVATQDLRMTQPEYFREIVEDLLQSALLDLYDWDRWTAVAEKYKDLPLDRVAFKVSARAVGRAMHHEKKGMHRNAVKQADGYHNEKYADGTTRVSTVDNDRTPLFKASAPFKAFTADNEIEAACRVVEDSRAVLSDSDHHAVVDVLRFGLYGRGTGRSLGHLPPKQRARVKAWIEETLND